MTTLKPVAALLCLGVSLACAQADEWDALGRVSKTQRVKVHLKDGTNLRGTIQQVEPERLNLVPSGDNTQVERDEITNLGPVDIGKLQRGAVVDVKLRDGHVLRGILQDRDNRYIWLAERTAPLMREDVSRVTRRARLRTAAIGAVAGAALMVCCATKASLGPGESAAGVAAGYAGAGALIGAAVGAAVGYSVTLYKAENSGSSKASTAP